jgi:membrane-bound ClpP family serine protease
MGRQQKGRVIKKSRRQNKSVYYPIDFMLQDILIMLVLAYVAFELIEHVLVPIIWIFLKRRKGTKSGIGGMKGNVVEIKSWNEKQGIVLFHAERWQAVADRPMQVGEKAIVEEVSGLTLKIKPCINTMENKVHNNRVK